MRKVFYACVLAMTAVCCGGMAGCSTGDFWLEGESRLPKWFAVPQNRDRGELRVLLNYYDVSFSIDDAALVLQDAKGHVLARVTGQHCWHPIMATKKTALGGLTPESYPHYVIFRVNESFEVLEHPRVSKTFRIIDDSTLVQQARDTGGCAKVPQ